ncbi:MDR family MFS transporter [Paenibacillus kyungheensis]|uniref:MDR family MFS transporter n=1 Tax=Paenibacillus kyungheensis TaxID=1452732 RepID=A0AAX3M2F9_9BACL|nr:MDR family MFS transporter [Paenibacillus kyungheensis]WCT56305.1 MDR family MFS transporter [Paenibacillus kyungheensis]
MSKATNRSMVTIGLLAALFIGALDSTVVSTASPRIISSLGGLSLISWIFSIYTLTTCIATPIFGKLGDLFGRKSIFAIGLGVFVLGSIMCGFANSMTELIWYRAIQGIGAGALTPVTFTIVGDLYPGKERAKVQGLFSSVWSVAGLFGPLVGGYFVDYISWRWIFFINLPVGIIAILFIFIYFHESFEKKQKSIDYAGAITFTIGMTALLLALLTGGEEYAWGSPMIIGLFVVTIIFMVLFLQIEKRAAEPMLPLSLFQSRILSIPYVLGFSTRWMVMGVTVYCALWIQDVFGYSATSAGLALMPMSIAWPVASTLAGRWMYKVGAKLLIVLGSAFVVGGSLWLALMHAQSSYGVIVGSLILIGLGMGFIVTPSLVVIQGAVGFQMRSVATSTNTLMNSLGQTISVAVFGMVFNAIVTTGTASQLASGIHYVFILMFAVSVLNLIIALFLPSSQQLFSAIREHEAPTGATPQGQTSTSPALERS